MRDYDDELMDYEGDAEDRYDDYDYEDEQYDDEDSFDEGFDGHEDSYHDDYEEEDYQPVAEYEDDYDSYRTSSIGKIDPNDRTLTVVITNTSGADAEAIVYGGNEEAAQPAGVTVTVGESTLSIKTD